MPDVVGQLRRGSVEDIDQAGRLAAERITLRAAAIRHLLGGMAAFGFDLRPAEAGENRQQKGKDHKFRECLSQTGLSLNHKRLRFTRNTVGYYKIM